MKRIILLIIISVFLKFADLYSQSIEEIFPDRPDQTESPDILYKNFFQFETGMIIEKNNTDPDVKQTNYSMPEMLIRYGIYKNAEFRIEVNYSREEMSAGDFKDKTTGLKPLGLGIKIKLADENKLYPKTAVLLNIDVPGTGNEIYRVKHMSPELIFLFSNKITDNIDLGYNAGISWDNEEKTNSEFYTASLGVSPFEKFSFFIESYGFFTKSTSSDFRIDYGLAYTILRNLQIDISSGKGLSKISPDYFMDFGFSFRLPK